MRRGPCAASRSRYSSQPRPERRDQPISALPGFLEWFARFLPLTHGLALVRYGLLGDSSGLHAIWRMGDPTAMAALSLGVVTLFAVALTRVSIRVFTRSAVR